MKEIGKEIMYVSARKLPDIFEYVSSTLYDDLSDDLNTILKGIHEDVSWFVKTKL